MPREIKVAEEQAALEFESWLSEMDIDPATDADAGDRERVIKAIMYGDLVFNEQGLAVYTPWRHGSTYKKPLTFRERTGADMMNAGAKLNQGKVKMAYALMASLCSVDTVAFSNLAGADLKTCEAIFSFLMA